VQKASAVKQTFSQSLRSKISALKKLETPSRIDHGLNAKFGNMNLNNDPKLIELPAVDLLQLVESRPLKIEEILIAKKLKTDPFVGFKNLIERHEKLVHQINTESYPYNRDYRGDSNDDIKRKFPKKKMLKEIYNLYKLFRRPIGEVLRVLQDNQNIDDDDQSSDSD